MITSGNSTVQRYLEEYYRKNVWDSSRPPTNDEDIVCPYFHYCREPITTTDIKFAPAQLSHIGDYYNLLLPNNAPLRIVIAGIEYGANDHYYNYGSQPPMGRVSLTERKEMIVATAKDNMDGRNAHMKGTTIALQDLFGLPPQSEDILVGGSKVHIFEAFALVNVLLCSRY